jgi:microcin C transport system substrate-binding protein
MPADRTWIVFHLRPQARWHDGVPITPEDVVFTYEILKEHGHPFTSRLMREVAQVEKLGPHSVKFTFGDGSNRELPLSVAQLAVQPRHYWQGRPFDKTTLEPPLGSGPYRFKAVDAPRSVTYERVDDYWGENISLNKGRYNFDEIHIDYYLDINVLTQALTNRAYDLRSTWNAKEFFTAYEGPALAAGQLVREKVPHQNALGGGGFCFNTRRAKFADRRVRWALSHAYDFEFINKTLYHGEYRRTRSYFTNTEMEATGLPQGEELTLLEGFKTQLPPEVFTQEYRPPSFEGKGGVRRNLLQAKKLLSEAGWQIREGQLAHVESGEIMEIEILNYSPAIEGEIGSYIENLKRLGIEAKLRSVDSAQYVNRLKSFDYDVVLNYWNAGPRGLSPGNEQRNYWSSEAADESGSNNRAGVRDPVVDALVELVVNAPDRTSLVTRARALDRVLQWGHYVILDFYWDFDMVLYWDKFGRPSDPIYTRYPVQAVTDWWYDAAKVTALGQTQ